MRRYIVAEDLKMELIGWETEPTDEDIERVIDNMPTADVAPVVHAKWDVNGHCTNCGGHAPFYCMTSTYYKSPYCFECGAKMRCDNEQE